MRGSLRRPHANHRTRLANKMTLRMSLLFVSQLLVLNGFAHTVIYDKEFDLKVTWGQHSPVGISKESFLVNGQSPGPVLEINEGDWVMVRVHNDSPSNITIHFHGKSRRDSSEEKTWLNETRNRNVQDAVVGWSARAHPTANPPQR